MSKIAKVTNVKILRAKSPRGGMIAHRTAITIQYEVDGGVYTKDIADIINLRRLQGMTIEFMCHEITSILDGMEFFVKAGEGNNKFVPASSFYDKIKLELDSRWKAKLEQNKCIQQPKACA